MTGGFLLYLNRGVASGYILQELTLSHVGNANEMKTQVEDLW